MAETVLQSEGAVAFYESIMDSEEQNSGMIALRFSKEEDIGKAYNFLTGYVELLARSDEKIADPLNIARQNVYHMARYCISGVTTDGKTPSEQYQEILGTLPLVFDALRIQRLAAEELSE